MLSLIKSLKISHELQPGMNLSMQMNHERARESPQQGLTLSLSRSPSTLLYHYHVFLIIFVVRICCLVRQPLPVIDFALFRSLAACNCVGTVWEKLCIRSLLEKRREIKEGLLGQLRSHPLFVIMRLDMKRNYVPGFFLLFISNSVGASVCHPAGK